MTASMNVTNGLNADTSRFTVTNSMEPVKMNALMHMGHRNEKPRVPISTPYDNARRKKLMQTGDVRGNAVLNALPMTAFLFCVRTIKYQPFFRPLPCFSSHAFSCRALIYPDAPQRRPTYYRRPRQTMRNRIDAWTSTNYVQSMRDEIIMLHIGT